MLQEERERELAASKALLDQAKEELTGTESKISGLEHDLDETRRDLKSSEIQAEVVTAKALTVFTTYFKRREKAHT